MRLNKPENQILDIKHNARLSHRCSMQIYEMLILIFWALSAYFSASGATLCTPLFRSERTCMCGGKSVWYTTGCEKFVLSSLRLSRLSRRILMSMVPKSVLFETSIRTMLRGSRVKSIVLLGILSSEHSFALTSFIIMSQEQVIEPKSSVPFSDQYFDVLCTRRVLRDLW